VRTKSQSNQAHSQLLLPPVTAEQQVVIIPGDQTEKRIDGYGGKDFEKRKVLRRLEMQRNRSTSGPGAEYDDGEELGDDEGLN